MSDMRPLTLISALSLGCATLVALPAIAQNLDAIEKRQELMKENGKAAKAGGAMAMTFLGSGQGQRRGRVLGREGQRGLHLHA